jgi:3-methylcrotonyl-CoA carboxylase alpha subunit
LIDEAAIPAPAGLLSAPATPVEHVTAAALCWLNLQRSAAPELGCWSQSAGFTGWRLSTGTAVPAALPSVVLKTGEREWAVRFGAPLSDGTIAVGVDDATHLASLFVMPSGNSLLHFGGRTLEVAFSAGATVIEVASPLGRDVFDCSPYLRGALEDAEADGLLLAPMMGKVVAIKAAAGDIVSLGQTVIVLESMKMELHVNAPFEGSVAGIRCAVGDMVERHQPLAEIGRSEATPAQLRPAVLE